MIDLLHAAPLAYVTIVVLVIASVVLHELGHGFAAIQQGDDTPIVTGHMTWNPMVHMGGISILLLLFAGIAFGAMPVNPRKFRSKYGDAIVSFAGPAVNLLLALLGVLLAGLFVRVGVLPLPTPLQEINSTTALLLLARLNLLLFFFNLLPIPPLDGSTVLGNLWPAFKRWTSNPDLQPVFLGGFLIVFAISGQLMGWTSDAINNAFVWLVTL